MSDASTTRTVDRALHILEVFSAKKNNFSLSELASITSMSTATTFRLLNTLEAHHFVYRDTSDLRYYLGSRALQLGAVATATLDIRKLSYPYMLSLQTRFNESVGLIALRGNERVCLERVDGTQTLRNCILIGETAPLNIGASGKILLAYQPESFLAQLHKHVPIAPKEDLEAIRANGYAISIGERTPGVFSVAAPIFDVNGNVHHSIYVSGPSFRFDTVIQENLIKEVCDAARQISSLIGYTPE